MRMIVAGLAMLAMGAPAMAQEVVVTGSRIRGNNQPTAASTSGIGIRRRADFAVQAITVYGDTRDREARRREILQTVRNAIELGGRRGVQLAYGSAIIEPLTLANYADKLAFGTDEDRNDAEQVTFVIKAPLSDGNAAAAFEALTAFAKTVPVVGRAVVQHDQEPGVSIVEPSRYRAEIVAAIATDATTTARAFGPDYAVEVDDLAGPVRWVLAGPTEVLLYLEHQLKVVPKR